MILVLNHFSCSFVRIGCASDFRRATLPSTGPAACTTPKSLRHPASATSTTSLLLFSRCSSMVVYPLILPQLRRVQDSPISNDFRYHARVLYIDIDVHHGDGVEEVSLSVMLECYFNFFLLHFHLGAFMRAGLRQGILHHRPCDDRLISQVRQQLLPGHWFVHVMFSFWHLFQLTSKQY